MSSPEEAHGEGAPEWMVSYADMITIMMAFFVVMYAMAGTKDNKKQQPVMNSLHRQFGRYVAGPNVFMAAHSTALPASGEGQKVRGSDGQSKKKSMSGESVRVTTVRPGDQLTMGGVIWFDDAAPALTDEQKRNLRIAADELAGKPQRVEIRGHTSTRKPADEKYRDQWDLAYARCHATMEYLVDQGIDSKRIRLSVASQNEPLEAANGATNGRRNARVEVFMLNEFADNAAAEKSATDAQTDMDRK